MSLPLYSVEGRRATATQPNDAIAWKFRIAVPSPTSSEGSENDFLPGEPVSSQREPQRDWWAEWDEVRWAQMGVHIPRAESTKALAHAKLLQQQFAKLARSWRQDTLHLSSMNQIAMHPAYQAIIGMGDRAIPLILQSLRQQPDHWFWALHSITQVDPVPKEARGRIVDMTKAWISWGRQHGYEV